MLGARLGANLDRSLWVQRTNHQITAPSQIWESIIFSKVDEILKYLKIIFISLPNEVWGEKLEKKSKPLATLGLMELNLPIAFGSQGK